MRRWPCLETPRSDRTTHIGSRRCRVRPCRCRAGGGDAPKNRSMGSRPENHAARSGSAHRASAPSSWRRPRALDLEVPILAVMRDLVGHGAILPEQLRRCQQITARRPTGDLRLGELDLPHRAIVEFLGHRPDEPGQCREGDTAIYRIGDGIAQAMINLGVHINTKGLEFRHAAGVSVPVGAASRPSSSSLSPSLDAGPLSAGWLVVALVSLPPTGPGLLRRPALPTVEAPDVRLSSRT